MQYHHISFVQVREMVPGAERKLREHQRLSTEHLVRHVGGQPHRQQYDSISLDQPKYECECGPLLTKTPPDVCTTNKCSDFPSAAAADVSANLLMPCTGESLLMAGQTVPIQIKNHGTTLSNFACHKYGTMPHPGVPVHQHSGLLAVPEVATSSSNNLSSYCAKSKTLQHPQRRKKCVKIETFQPECSFSECPRRPNTFGYSGSAV